MRKALDGVAFAKALADETRQEIMGLLCCRWLSVSDVVDRLGGRVNQPTVSHHLRKLEDAGLVDVRPEGRHRLYTLNQRRLHACCTSIASAFAPDYAPRVSLAELERVADEAVAKGRSMAASQAEE